MVIATETTQDLSYRARIEAIRKTKSAHTDEKIRIRGFMNIDDHGWIPWPDPIPFEPKSNHPSGGCYGPKCIGENFREWLKVHPVYIHPMSSLAGAWMQGGPPGVGGWRPEDRATHLEEVQKKYHFIMPGIGGMNHIGPDMRIGLDLGWGGAAGQDPLLPRLQQTSGHLVLRRRRGVCPRHAALDRTPRRQGAGDGGRGRGSHPAGQLPRDR